MGELILIKLGGSVITDKKREFTAREDNIVRFAKEIKSALRMSSAKIIIGHGAGSFAHTPASIYKTKEGLVNTRSLFGMGVVEEAARWLNGIVIKKFISQKLPVFPFSPGSFLISDAKVYSSSYIEPLKKALQIKIIPVVYGDVILDKKIGCTIFSTEKIFSILARKFAKEYEIRIIYCTDTDGVYDSRGITIEKITSENFFEVKKAILGASATDVTGGMLHKVGESVKLAKKTGIKTLIINGTKAGSLRKAILGKKVKGTLIN